MNHRNSLPGCQVATPTSLPHLSCASNQQGLSSRGIFPFQEYLVYFSSVVCHKHIKHLIYNAKVQKLSKSQGNKRSILSKSQCNKWPILSKINAYLIEKMEVELEAAFETLVIEVGDEIADVGPLYGKAVA